MLKLKSKTGRNVAIRLIRKGDLYGKDDLMKSDFELPVVEFFDASYVFPANSFIKDKANMPGCFTGDRIYAHSMFSEKASRGLTLSTAWRLVLSRENIKEICEWLLSELSEEEIQKEHIIFVPDFYEERDLEFGDDDDIFPEFEPRVVSQEEVDEYLKKKEGISSTITQIENIVQELHRLEEVASSYELRKSFLTAKMGLLDALRNLIEERDNHHSYTIEQHLNQEA